MSARLLIALPLLALAATAAGAAATAVPVSPLRTTVYGGETQVFAVRFFDAQGLPSVGEAVHFFNDACGTFNGGNGLQAQAVTDSTGLATASFTALNTGLIKCTVGASGASGAAVNFDVLTYKLGTPVLTATFDPAEPRPGQRFRVTAGARLGIYSLFNVDIGARIVPGAASATLPATTFNSAQDGFVQFDVVPDGRLGDYSIELSYRGTVSRVAVAPPENPWQDVWWSGAAENGWGMSIVQHRDMLFTIIYAYDEAGKPTWYVMPSGQWNDAHTAFSGDVFLPRGSPYYAYDASRFDIGASLGRATITFGNAANAAALDYTIKGISGHKSISRILFGLGAKAARPGLGDMWWGGTAQNGWGFSVLQQGPDLFTLWFTYDEAGAATWFAMPAGYWTDARTYRGTLYRSAGAPWLGRDYDVSAFRMNDIGWYVITFNDDGGATFQYSMGGGPVASLPLSRIPF